VKRSLHSDVNMLDSINGQAGTENEKEGSCF